MTRRLTVRPERWPLARPFAIARGTKTVADVVVVEIEEEGARGWGECVPYARYGETVDGVAAAIQALAGAIAAGMDRQALQEALPSGAARNALDGALWDLEAKRAGVRAWELAGLPPPPPLPMEPAAPSPVVGIIFSSFFWTLLVALVVGALLFFLRERGYRLDRARVQRSLASLWDFLRIVWDRMRGRVRSAGRSLRARLDSLPPALNTPPLTTPRRRFLRLNALSPREQIRYYYLATVRRASERGVPRAPNETPLEYFGDLKQGWPEAEPDLEQLTSAFLEARYSAEPMDTTVAGRVRERWKRVKDRLRGK